MPGRPPSSNQSPAQRDAAARERTRYQALSKLARRAMVRRRDPEAVSEAEARRYQKHRPKRDALTRENAARYPEKTAARNEVNAAKQAGALKVPAACENCGAKASLEAHHPDHSKPLKVNFLCPKCHGKTYRLT